MRATMTVRLTARPSPSSCAGGNSVRSARIDGQLQPDEHEHERVDRADDGLPDALTHQAALGRQDARRAPAHDQPRGDRRRGRPQTPSDLRRRDRRPSGATSETTISSDRVAGPLDHLRHGQADDDPDQDPADPEDDERPPTLRPARTSRDPARPTTATRYAMSDVASLTRLSPSRIVTTRRGTPSRLKTAVAATASGGATIAPERQRGRQAHARHERVGDQPDGERREQHEPDGQQQDRAGRWP